MNKKYVRGHSKESGFLFLCVLLMLLSNKHFLQSLGLKWPLEKPSKLYHSRGAIVQCPEGGLAVTLKKKNTSNELT